jgi:hypothetical protein
LSKGEEMGEIGRSTVSFVVIMVILLAYVNNCEHCNKPIQANECTNITAKSTSNSNKKDEDSKNRSIKNGEIYVEYKGTLEMSESCGDDDLRVPEDVGTPSGTEENEIASENIVQEQIKITNEQVKEANSNDVPQINVQSFADSVEEEYLALNMIAANTEISLAAFPNLQNAEYLNDVMLKVIYQNPYIIGFKTASYDENTMKLEITYNDDASTIHQKQLAVASEASNIVKTVIKEGMSDEEKVMALWNWLEKHTSYDDEAIEYAKNNNFKDIKGYEDSFTSYGIICRKKGVCQSYAYCFKILLSLCNIKCITLTGYIDKTLPHAWNAVYINGEWRWIDVTNNMENSGIPYILYQTSSKYAEEHGYALDELYEINTKLGTVSSNDNSKDWYIENSCYANTKNDLIKLTHDNYDKFDSYVCIKSEYEPELNKEFIDELVKALKDKGVSKNNIRNLRMSYKYGIFVIDKK